MATQSGEAAWAFSIFFSLYSEVNFFKSVLPFGSLLSLREAAKKSHNMSSLLKIWLKNAYTLTLLHSEQPKLHRVLAILSAIGLKL